MRVVCSYIDDVYRVAEMVERQQDLEIVKRQDYIKTPNYNGYRSLHLDLRVPVYLSDRTEQVLAEVQIRTIAMDFWASLEHDIRYKADRSRLPEVERHHEERYRALLHNVETGAVFAKSEVKIWECRNCGHIVVGTAAPEVCPVCNHPQSYFELHAENY